MLLSRSKRAPAIAFSSSEGFCRDGELRAILLMAAMIASDGAEVLVAGVVGGEVCSHQAMGICCGIGGFA